MTSQVHKRLLLARLAERLGPAQARLEFRWLKDHARSSGDAALDGMVHRRLKGEPLQYILGTQPFGPLDIKVRKPVLIPRSETEDWTLRLARRLSSRLPSGSHSSHSTSSSDSSSPRTLDTCQEPPAETKRKKLNILDLCTGTGCIPLLLCHMLSTHANVHALGVDVSNEAISLAHENLEHIHTHSKKLSDENQNNNIACDGYEVRFIQADVLSPSFSLALQSLDGRDWWGNVDVLTANPPYIPWDEYVSLPSSVKDFEDPRALLGDPVPVSNPRSPPVNVASSSTPLDTDASGRRSSKGLTFYHAISRLLLPSPGVSGLVKPGGVVALEVGAGQSDEVRDLFEMKGLGGETEVWKDPWGVERVVVCTLPLA